MKYLILGAGPAGLTLANRLLEMGEESFLVLEKENEAGGLCRSAEVDGKMLDIGGGHFLDVRRPAVNRFLFQFMPKEEWNSFERISKIDLGYAVIDYPMEASIWQLPEEEQIAHLLAISKAGCNTGEPKPKKFSEWIPWKLGEKIAADYMIPYNSKMWSMNLDKLGTYWMEKLPNVSFEDTLRSCLKRERHFESLPGHASFYYPKKYGYGELWLRMAEKLKGKIEYGVEVNELNFGRRIINGQYKADIIVNTIPWTCFETIQGVSDRFLNCIRNLKHTSVAVKYYDEPVDTDAHWTYFPDESVEYHRILYRCNFCEGAKGYWTESNALRADLTDGRWHYVNKYAYPVNTIKKPESIAYILESAGNRKIFGLGRWGEWEHYNSDTTVEAAMQLADRLMGKL